MAYIKSQKNQNWLLPPSIKEMIPKDHICFLVEEFVESLNFNNFDMSYAGPGHPAYHPRILTKIIIQGMLSKERSSRKLSRACKENIAFMYLSEKVQPDFRTICRFRKNNMKFIKHVFKETIKLAQSHNLVDLNTISIDGTIIKASASRKKSVKKETLDKLDEIIEKMIEEDIAQDEQDKLIYGDKEDGLTGMDKRDIKKLVRNYWKNKSKKKVKEKVSQAKQELSKNTKLKRASLTDSDCRNMKNKKHYSEPSYNAQISTDSKNQIIIANDICQDSHDAHQLIPQIKNIKENIGEINKDTKVSADCGYSSGDNFHYLETEGLDGYIPNRAQAQELEGKKTSLKRDDYEYDWKNDVIIIEGKKYYYRYSYVRKGNNIKNLVYKTKDLKLKKTVPKYFRERLRMKAKMNTEEGKKVYRSRKTIVEPVFGNIKQNLGFREFVTRGLNSVKTEFNLVCIAHNLMKVWKHLSENQEIEKINYENQNFWRKKQVQTSICM
ncbi:IS1182 family transposase [Candidatus Micrarchaeota archaeon]|nr:IS1182 family transposase [Candidatus Micrarchaeota archaeon]